MKKYYLQFIVFSLVFTIGTNAQNKLIENASYQQTMQFDYAINKQEAVSLYLSKNGLDNNNSFVANKENTDDSGMKHQRNQQYYKGLKVEFGTYITHIRNGNVVSINGELYNPSSLNITPVLSERACFQQLLNNLNASKYLWQDKQQAEIVGYNDPVGELVIFPIVRKGELKLAYKYDIYGLEPLFRDEIYVDADNGKILYRNPIIKHAHDFVSTNSKENTNALVTTTANTKYSGARSMETTFDSSLNKWVLNDITRGNGIVTYNCQNVVNTYQNIHFQDNDNVWTTAEHANAQFDNAAQDCHWGSEMVYDFWKNIFNRNSYDNNNSQIKSYMHYRPTAAAYSNAFWNGAFMTYGDGSSKPFSSIDVCGHEIGHAVCTHTANLAYQNQSGAMNEGLSDIWGACIEHYGRTGALTGTPVANVWKVGEDIAAGALRSMNAPNTKGDPDTFQGTYWVETADDGFCTPTTANDRCGVHTNSGVMNRWFYVLTAGASGTNNAVVVADRDTYNVTGIGMVKASQITYYAERDYLTPNATYFDMRAATIQVASNLYCAVGPEIIAVTNAWNSVNVGAAFISYPNDVALRQVAISSSINCGTSSFTQPIVFENNGTNPITSVTISYNIDGGANTNTTWTGNIATCSSSSVNLSINTGALSKGTHILNVTTTIASDGNSSNNTKTGVIFVNTAGTNNQINTFENATDVLISYDDLSTNNVWQRGTSAKTTLTDAVAGNSKVYATVLNDVYQPFTKSYLVSQCYNLSTLSNPMVKFDMAFDTESNYDILYMQYSIDGGTTWNLLGTTADTNWYTSNSNCSYCPGNDWSGEAGITNSSGTTNDTKRLYSKSLSAINSATNAIFRFVFQSNGSTEYDGAIIDNFVVEGALATNEQSFNDLKIFPNPTSSVININFESKSNEPIAVSIFDMQGRSIQKLQYDGNFGAVNQQINISNLPTGIYLLKLNQGNLEYNSKICKE